MADPTVKVKVVLDDSAAQAQLGAFAKTIQNSIGKAFKGQKIQLEGMDKAIASTKALSSALDSSAKQVDKATQSLNKLATASDKVSKAQNAAKTAASDAAKSTQTQQSTLQKLLGSYNSAVKGIFAFNNAVFALQVVLNTVGNALKSFYSAAREGAVINQTAIAFDRLTVSLLDMPDALDQLGRAARGTVSELALMQQTLTLIQGASPDVARALGQAAPNILEIARAANILNPALGSTEQNFARLALGIRRSSVRILDDIGLIIRLGEAYDIYAEKVGKSVKELTAEEKQLALLAQVQSEGQNLIDQLGGAADSQVDSFARLETAWENLTNTMKSGLADAVLPAIQILSGDFALALDDITAATTAAAQAQAGTDPFGPLVDGAKAAQDELDQSTQSAAEFGATLDTILKALSIPITGGLGALETSLGALGIDVPILSDIQVLEYLLPEITGDMEEFNTTVGELIDLGAGFADGGASFADFIQTLQRELDGFEPLQFFDEIAAGAAESSSTIQEFALSISRSLGPEFFVTTDLENLATQIATISELPDPGNAIPALVEHLQELFEVQRQLVEAEDADQALRTLVERYKEMGDEVVITEEKHAELLKTWSELGVKATGLTEEVAAVAVSLGTMTQAEADASLAAQSFNESLNLLLLNSDFVSGSADLQVLALYALEAGYASTGAAAIEYAQATMAGTAGAADAAAAWLNASLGLREVSKAMDEAAKATSKSLQEMLKAKGAPGELAAEFIKVAEASGATVEQLLAAAAASGLLSEGELKAADVAGQLAAKMEELNAQVAAGAITAEEAANAFFAFADSLNVAAGSALSLSNATAGFGTFVSELNATLGGSSGGGGGLASSAATFRDSFVEMIQGVAEAQAALDKAIAEEADEEKIEELTKAVEEAGGATRNWKNELFELAIQAGASVEQIIGLGLATGQLTQAQADAAFKQAAAAAAIEKIAQAYVSGQISAEEASEAVGSLQKQIKEGGTLDLSEFGINVGQLASQTAQAGSAAGGAAKETKTWRDNLLELADAEGVTAQQAVEIAQNTGKFTDEQIKAALAAEAMADATEVAGKAIGLGTTTVAGAISDLEDLEEAVTATGLSLDDLALFLDFEIEGEKLSAQDLADAIKAFLGGVDDPEPITVTQAVEVVIERKETGEGPSLKDSLLPEEDFLSEEDTTVTISVDGDPQGALDAAEDARARTRSVADDQYELQLEANTAEAEEGINKVSELGAKLDSSTYEVSVDADTSAATAAVAELISYIQSQTAQITVTTTTTSNGTTGATVDGVASQGARVYAGDVTLVGDSGRSDPSEMFVTENYVKSGGESRYGFDAPLVIGSNGPAYFESLRPGWILPYVPGSFGEIMAIVNSLGGVDSTPNPPPQTIPNPSDSDGWLKWLMRIDPPGNTIPRLAQRSKTLTWPEWVKAWPGAVKVLNEFHEGGFTGGEVGIVHPGEYVLNPEATAAIGVPALDAFHEAAQGANGLADALGMIDPVLGGLPATEYEEPVWNDGPSHTDNRKSVTINVANPHDASIVARREIGALL